MESKVLTGFTEEDVKFLDSLNNTGVPESNIYLTSRHGYIRNLDKPVKVRIEDIIRRVANPRFIMDYHCGDCVKKAVLQVYGKLDEYRAAADTTLDSVPPVEPGQTPEGGKVIERVVIETGIGKMEVPKSALADPITTQPSKPRRKTNEQP